jgi:ribonuclease HI
MIHKNLSQKLQKQIKIFANYVRILFMQGKAFIDGGARGNPGPAAIGALVHGEIPFSISEYIGETTNNVAEYTALVKMLALALAKGYKGLDIYADSELMVKQIRGEYKVKNNGLKPLYLDALKYLQQLQHFTITHVKREYNKDADALVNAALDQKLGL